MSFIERSRLFLLIPSMYVVQYWLIFFSTFGHVHLSNCVSYGKVLILEKS